MNKINVAIADDNQRTVEMMTELLEQESDIEVIASADDGEEALRIIKEKQPDVVLLDIIMPKLDGIGVLERLQTEDLSKRPIIIMVSAMGQENVCEEAMELGASYFILKPFDLRTIIKIIDSYRCERMLYISCKPTSLARDLEILADAGYKVIKATAVDQFPNTVHIETICLLELQ